MPPKQKITKNAIADTAFSIVEEKGLSYLTARNVAEKMNISTKPIYFYFSCMADLRKETMRKAAEILLTYMSKPYTERIFLNMGIGFTFFARDHKILYRHMFMENSEFKDLVEEFFINVRQQMKKDKQFINMPGKERYDLLNTMWIFTHGLASFICVGLIEKHSDPFIIETLEKVGSAVIDTAVKKKRKHKTIVKTRRTHA